MNRTAVTSDRSRTSTRVLHGTWLPENNGRLVIWAEQQVKARGRRGNLHPYRLGPKALAEIARDSWNIAANRFTMTELWLTLPSGDKGPVLSPELQAVLGEESPLPERWSAWRVKGMAVKDPITVLTTAEKLRQDPDTIPGQDLLFWSEVLRALHTCIQRHEFLPAIFAGNESATGPRARSGRGRKKKSVEFETGWEVTESYWQSTFLPLAQAMPGICRVTWSKNRNGSGDQPLMRSSNDLMAHFVSEFLHHHVGNSRLPKTVTSRFKGSFIGFSVGAETRMRDRSSPAKPVYMSNGVALDTTHWQKWKAWQDQINRASRFTDEQICFRLLDPDRRTPDCWRLEILLSSRKEPSLLTPLREFWKSQHPIEKVREILLQLGQAARLFERVWDGMQTEFPDSVDLTRDEALGFLHHDGPVLQDAGFRVIVPSWWTQSGQRRIRVRMVARMASGGLAGAGSDSSGLLGLDSVVDWNPVVLLNGHPVTREEWQKIALAKPGLVQIRGEWMELSAEEIARLEEIWLSDGQDEQRTIGELLREQDESTEIEFEGELGARLNRLEDDHEIALQDIPGGFVGKLRQYQLRGYSWLASSEDLGFGVCLADDMGLGKTVQVLTTMLRDKESHPDSPPTLLVAPTSVLGNWQREAGRFTPEISTHVHHGPARPRKLAEFRKSLAGFDVIITSFGVARLDRAILSKIRWRRLVIDEAQNAKNPTAKITRALRSIHAARRIALTGTPVENRLLDLWSIFSVISPGYLGTVTDFRRDFERPIIRKNDRRALVRLREMVTPFILRRLKTDKAIISDLPDKIEQNAICNLTSEQAALYEAVVNKVTEALESAEDTQRQGLMLSSITLLKQICNHPAQYLQDGSIFSERRSHKLARTCAMLDDVIAEGESALVFTQFTEIGHQLELLFRSRIDADIYYLHGGTPRPLRERMVEMFQETNTEPAIFVLSLRAAGVGLTLTRANHVIHFDRWWNPAVENQATDRAYRIGQERIVMVHKMVTMGTLEERIDELIESKKRLAEEVVGSGESWLAEMGDDSFRELIALDRGSAIIN